MYQCKECEGWSTINEWNEQLDKSTRLNRHVEIQLADEWDRGHIKFECPRCQARQVFAEINKMPYHELAKKLEGAVDANAKWSERHGSLFSDLGEVIEQKNRYKEFLEKAIQDRDTKEERIKYLESHLQHLSRRYGSIGTDRDFLKQQLAEKREELEELDACLQNARGLAEANSTLLRKLNAQENAYKELYEQMVGYRMKVINAHKLLGEDLEEAG